MPGWSEVLSLAAEGVQTEIGNCGIASATTVGDQWAAGCLLKFVSLFSRRADKSNLKFGDKVGAPVEPIPPDTHT